MGGTVHRIGNRVTAGGRSWTRGGTMRMSHVNGTLPDAIQPILFYVDAVNLYKYFLAIELLKKENKKYCIRHSVKI